MPRLLIDLRHHLATWTAGPEEARLLAEATGWEVIVATADNRPALLAAGADALWTWHLAAEDAARCPGLAWVSTPAAGADYLPVADLVARGLAVTVSHGNHGPVMAEHALGMILALARHLHRAPAMAAAGGWWRQEFDGTTVVLEGARMVIAGYGAIGRALAHRARAFGIRVMGLGQRLRPADELGVTTLGPDDHDAALAIADLVVNLLPHTPATRGWLSAERVRALRPGCILVNLGRGETVDQEAILAAVRDGRLRAGLDVCVPEPLPADHQLRHQRHLLLTPHVAAMSADYLRRAARVQAEQMQRFAAGEALRWQVSDDPGSIRDL